MKNRTVCFTGHRNVPQDQGLSKALRNTITQLINDGYCYYGAGGAFGFDTIAAEMVLALKTKFPHIKLILVLPCLTQTNGWSIEEKKRYEKIKQAADKVVYTSQNYYSGCMHKRNRHLVDNSSVCVCYLTETRGGTFYTVNYAKEKGLRILNIAERYKEL